MSTSKSSDSPLRKIEWGLLWFAVIAACVAVVAYTIAFSGWSLGDPVDWGAFGDYMGGVLNPIIGIITVLLIVLTLATTRKEAADARAEMKAQLLHFERQQILTDMYRRLEGLLQEWNRILDSKCPRIVVGSNESGTIRYSDDIAQVTIRDLIESLDVRRLITNYRMQNRMSGPMTDWQRELFSCVSLLSELNVYLKEYEEEAGNSDIAEYYRRRVLAGVTTLGLAGVLHENVETGLEPQPLR